MDMILAKFLLTCLVCGLLGFTTGIPLNDPHDDNISIKHKRSNPLESIGSSLPFGLPQLPFSIPNPMTTVQNTLNSLGGLLTPAGASNNEDNKPDDGTSKKKRATSDTIGKLSPALTETRIARSDMLVQSNTIVQNIQPDIKNKEVITKKERKDLPVDDTNIEISNKEDDKSKKNAETSKLDESLIDLIFNDARDSITTEASVTATGDYESTTAGDEEIRIPPEVMASLMGR